MVGDVYVQPSHCFLNRNISYHVPEHCRNSAYTSMAIPRIPHLKISLFLIGLCLHLEQNDVVFAAIPDQHEHTQQLSYGSIVLAPNILD